MDPDSSGQISRPFRLFKSPTPAGMLSRSGFEGINKPSSMLNDSLFMSQVAIDPITLAINECMIISSAMRKVSRYSQSGVAAILGGGDIFGGEDELLSSSLGISTNSNNNGGLGRSSSVNDNPLLSSFLQLRSILTDAKNIFDIDSLTILQPFLLVIKSSSTSGHITSLALDSISKFFNYEIISFRSKNLQASLIQINSALTHCRFEAADQNSDDAVLLKVLRLMETVVTSPLSNLLPNDVVSEVIQTCLSLACNKKRSEVLRKAAEMTISLITARIFRQLRVIEPENERIDSLQTDFTGNQLPEDVIGSAKADMSTTDLAEQALKANEEEKRKEMEQSSESQEQSPDQEQAQSNDNEDETEPNSTVNEVKSPVSDEESHHEESFGITCINEYMGILISMISPSNQYQHMESTRVLALNLVNTAIEVSGNDIPKHNSLKSLIADPVSKHVLLLITTADSPPLLQAALKLFTTMAIVLGEYLKSQIELTFALLFKSILPDQVDRKNDALKGNTTAVNSRLASSKEMLLESVSLLWTRKPYFFTEVFIDYDCDFERSDLSKKVLEFICKLALPESARITTDNVPPICLEGLLSFISGISDRVKSNPNSHLKDTENMPQLIQNKKKKNSFIKCTDAFNKKPSEGIKQLVKEGFLKNENDTKEVAEFVFNKSGRLNKKVLGEFLAKPSNKEILRHFISLFDYQGLRVDEAIRLLLRTFRLPGESQQIERIVELFAKRYADCQEEYHPENEEEEFVKPDSDSVFVLSYSIILLNTDLHNPQVKRQMTLDAYKRNLRGTFNGGDYPEWYLAKIYSSIKDREIIMPEEHHGTDKWFDDVWHNLISSQTSSFKTSLLDELDSDEICLYDKHVFEENVDTILDTLISVFKEASDDHIITRLMSTIDKCVNICLFYGIETSIDKLVGLLADLTLLAGERDKASGKPSSNSDDSSVREEIPITQIKIEKKDEAITVSEMAVWFGRDFKAQISTVVLFRLIKKTECKITHSWRKVLQIIMTLFENCLIDPNLFVDFQSKLKLPPLPKVKPRYIINRSKPLKDSGILSTFSSFLKGYSDEPPEPTDQEVESTLSSIDCVKSLNVATIFKSIAQGSDEGRKLLVRLLLEVIPKSDDSNKRYFETELLFIFEIVVCLCLLVNDKDLLSEALTNMSQFKNTNEVISKKGKIRLMTYKLLIIRILPGVESMEILAELLQSLITFDKEFLTKNGEQLIQPIISLADDDSWCCKQMLKSEDFWKVLRLLGSIPVYAKYVLSFTESLVKQAPNEIGPDNFMSILGLLDEISSIGALAAQWEQENEKLVKQGQKSDTDNKYLKEVIDLSKKSISLTSEFSPIVEKEGFNSENGSHPLVQALAHQCFNPCREVRGHGLGVLRATVLGLIEKNPELKPYGVFEYGLFPLLGELAKTSVLQTDPSGFIDTQMEALSLISKVFLQFIGSFDENETKTVWFGILDGFKTFDNIREQNNKNDNLIKESGSELLKNMILVLQTSNVLDETNSELWGPTWEKVDVLYPNLKKDLAPGDSQGVKSETSENTDVTDNITDTKQDSSTSP